MEYFPRAIKIPESKINSANKIQKSEGNCPLKSCLPLSLHRQMSMHSSDILTTVMKPLFLLRDFFFSNFLRVFVFCKFGAAECTWSVLPWRTSSSCQRLSRNYRGSCVLVFWYNTLHFCKGTQLHLAPWSMAQFVEFCTYNTLTAPIDRKRETMYSIKQSITQVAKQSTGAVR